MAEPLQRAVEHYQAGRISEARWACERALSNEPVDAAALNLMGAVLNREGRAAAAVGALRRALRCQPDFLLALLNLGGFSHAAGQPARAAACYRRLALLDPGAIHAEAKLGILRQEAGDTGAAARHLRRAVLLGAGAGDVTNLGTMLIADGRPEEAGAALRRSLTLDPGAAHALALLGDVLLALGDPDGGALHARARTLDPGSIAARRGAGRAGRYRRAAHAAWVPGLPRGLVVRGHPDGVTGYAYMTRRFVHGLRERGVPLDLIGLVGDGDAVPQTPPVRACAALGFLTPTMLEPVPGLVTVLFSMFEGTRIPPAWARRSRRADLIVVPAESSRQAWVGHGIPEDRVRVCPLGADLDAGEGDLRPLALFTPGGREVSGFRYRFLNVSDIVPRKNLDGLLRVWLRATTAHDDAILVLKPGKGGERAHAAVAAALHRAEQAVGRSVRGAAPIAVVAEALSETGMSRLFRLATHYWSLSHGEGWDLPMTRAGAMGLQLIAPRHSAYLDYLDEDVAHMIPAGTGPALAPDTGEPWPPFFGLEWWNPDEDAATALIAAMVRGDAVPPRDARTRLLARFTWRQATDRLIAILRDTDLL